MALYNNPNRVPSTSCDDTRGPCGPNECGPIPGNDLNCCPPIFPQREVCPVEVYVPGCQPGYEQPLDGSVNCDCIPCADDLAFTTVQKEFIQQMIQGLLSNISPYAYSCCQIVDPSGHHYPLTPRPATTEDGTRLLEWRGEGASPIDLSATGGVNSGDYPGYITGAELEAAVSAGDLTQAQANQFGQAFEQCCDVPMHSAFVSQGLAPFGAMGLTGIEATPIGNLASIEGHERLGKLFCCALDKVFAAPTLELVDDDGVEGPNPPVAFVAGEDTDGDGVPDSAPEPYTGPGVGDGSDMNGPV